MRPAIAGPDPPQLVTPARSQFSAAAKSLVVGDRTVRLLGLGGPASDRLLSRVASDIGAAINAVEAFWGVDWSREISVVAAGSDEQFRAAAGGGPASQWADIAAVTVADRVDPAHRVAVGQRIVFAPGAANMSEAALRIVLAHELFHYAARADTAPDAPRWLTEGVADFVARPQTPVPADALPVPLTLPVGCRPGRARAAALAGVRPRLVVRPLRRRHLRDDEVARPLPGHLRCRSRRCAHRRPRRPRHTDPAGRARALASVALSPLA